MVRRDTLKQKYKLFKIKLEENIQGTEKCFIHIVNHMKTLRKTFLNEDLINKVLRYK